MNAMWQIPPEDGDEILNRRNLKLEKTMKLEDMKRAMPKDIFMGFGQTSGPEDDSMF